MDRLTRQDASSAVTDLGWRYLLGTFRAHVRVDSLASAAQVATVVAGVVGAGDHLRVDLRPGQAILTLQAPETGSVDRTDIESARRISAALARLGLATEPGGRPRTAQILEIAIDAMDIPAVRPFWRAVLDYVDETPGDDGLVDPLGQGPAVWFQQMDQPRPQRNRIHIDISVPHDAARQRVDAALAAGGRLVSDEVAPRFWVLADAEGNEACVTTWQDRD